MSQEENRDIEIILAARTAIYRLLHAIFGGNPQEQVLDTLSNGNLARLAEVFCDEGDALQRAVQRLENSAQAIEAASPEALDKLDSIYCRLFVGPGKAVAEPWESVYNEGEAMLFQKSTLDVRKAYVAQGLIPQSYPHVADDHIALELDFMGMLARRMAEKPVQDSEFASLCSASADFLDTHMLGWVPKFCKRVESAQNPGIYRDAAAVLNEFIIVDRAVLSELTEATNP